MEVVSRLFEYIKGNAIKLGILFILVFVIFTRLPFFIYFPIPGIWPDTYDYYTVVNLILNNNWSEIQSLPIDLPMGYPLFLYLCYIIFKTTFSVVILQSIISISSFVFLFVTFGKSLRWYQVYLLCVAIIVYLIDDETMDLDTMLYTESIFRSSVIFMLVFLIKSIRDKTSISFILLSFFVILSAFFRPNGVVFYIIPFIIAVYFYKTNFVSKFLKYGLISFIFFNICWSFFNYSVKGYFAPSEFYRIQKVINQKVVTDNLIHKKDNLIHKEKYNKFKSLKENTLNLLGHKSQFYFATLKGRHLTYYDNNGFKSLKYSFDHKLVVSQVISDLAINEYYTDKYKLRVGLYLDKNNKIANKLIYINHLIYKIHRFLFHNIYWLGLFYLFFLINIITYIYNREVLLFMLVLLSLIYFVSLFAVSFFQGNPQSRYIQVFEFIIYINILVSFAYYYQFVKDKLFLKKSSHAK